MPSISQLPAYDGDQLDGSELFPLVETDEDVTEKLTIDELVDLWTYRQSNHDINGRRNRYHANKKGEWEKLSVNEPIIPVSSSGWDSEFVEEGRIVEGDNEYKMLYLGSDGSTASIGLATAPFHDPTDWTKSANNPVITSADFAATDGDLRGIGFVRDKQGQYQAAIIDKFGTSDQSVHFISSSDASTWTHEKELPLSEGNAENLELIRVGPYYYLIVAVDLDSFWVYKSETINGTWERHFEVPIRESSKSFFATPSAVVSGNQMYLHWEEYDSLPTDGSSVSFSASIPLEEFVRPWGARVRRLTALESFDGDLNNKYPSTSGSFTQDPAIIRGYLNPRFGRYPSATLDNYEYRLAVNLRARVTTAAGETVTLRVNERAGNTTLASVSATDQTTETQLESGWSLVPKSLSSGEVGVYSEVSTGANSASIAYVELQYVPVPQVVEDEVPGFADNQHIVTGEASGWDEDWTAEHYINHMGGEYIYVTYEAADNAGNNSEIGLARARI
jgi:hypothetical protein